MQPKYRIIEKPEGVFRLYEKTYFFWKYVNNFSNLKSAHRAVQNMSLWYHVNRTKKQANKEFGKKVYTYPPNKDTYKTPEEDKNYYNSMY